MMLARGSRLDTAIRSGSPFLVYGAELPTADFLDALMELGGPFTALDFRSVDTQTVRDLTERARASISGSGLLVVLLGDVVSHAVEQVLQSVVDGQVRAEGPFAAAARPRLVVLQRSDLPRGRLADLLDLRLFADTALRASVPRASTWAS